MNLQGLIQLLISYDRPTHNSQLYFPYTVTLQRRRTRTVTCSIFNQHQDFLHYSKLLTFRCSFQFRSAFKIFFYQLQCRYSITPALLSACCHHGTLCCSRSFCSTINFRWYSNRTCLLFTKIASRFITLPNRINAFSLIFHSVN